MISKLFEELIFLIKGPIQYYILPYYAHTILVLYSYYTNTARFHKRGRTQEDGSPFRARKTANFKRTQTPSEPPRQQIARLIQEDEAKRTKTAPPESRGRKCTLEKARVDLFYAI